MTVRLSVAFLIFSIYSYLIQLFRWQLALACLLNLFFFLIFEKDLAHGVGLHFCMRVSFPFVIVLLCIFITLFLPLT